MKRREWNEWMQTKLKAEPINFRKKNLLKRKKVISRQIIWMSVISSAAVSVLLITLLNSDPVVPASVIAEKKTTLPSSNPLSQKGITLINPHNESSPAKNGTGLFSIKKNPESQEASGIIVEAENTGSITDKGSVVKQREVEPGPVRITGLVAGNRDLVNEGTYDRIERLDIPLAPVHLSRLSLSQLSEVDLQQVFDDYTEKNEISLWTLANAGIKGINRLTGSDMSLFAARDDEGDVLGFRFKSRRFSFATPLDRTE